MRQIHIFFNLPKAIRQFVWLFTCFVRVVNLKLFLVLICTLAEQFQIHNSYKSCESKLFHIGIFKKICINLSHIYLDVLIYLLELVPKEFNHLAAILHVYARGRFDFYEVKKNWIFQKENGNIQWIFLLYRWVQKNGTDQARPLW